MRIYFLKKGLALKLNQVRVIHISNLKIGCLAVLMMLGLLNPTMVSAGVDEQPDETIQEAKKGAAVGPSLGSFVAVPIPVSNPTVGTGVQAVLMYLHKKKDAAPEAHNTTSGLTGLYTVDGNWFAGAFHDGSLADDRVRVSGGTGYGEVEMKFYGIGNTSILKDHPIKFQFKTFVFSPSFLVRLFNDHNWFAGANYMFLSSHIIFNTSEIIPGVGDADFGFKTSGLGVTALYDSRDDNYYPTLGQLFQATLTNFNTT